MRAAEEERTRSAPVAEVASKCRGMRTVVEDRIGSAPVAIVVS